MRIPAAGVLVLGFLALAGCGGGGGGNAPPPAPGGPTAGTSFAGLDPARAGHAATAAGRAADARPRAGSVTQSSNVRDGITVDRVTATAEYGAAGNRHSIRNGSAWSIGTADGDPEPIEGVPAPFRGQVLHRRVSGATLYVAAFSDIGAPATREAAGGMTDRVPDTDYLSAGVWLIMPDGAASADDVVFGAFADGSDPFRQDSLQGVRGTARYAGAATGVYSDRSVGDTELGHWDGAVVLTADFGTPDRPGTISGALTDIDVDDERSGSLDLEAAPIGSSNSGFFEGRVSGTLLGIAYDGRWGGQFFGNGEADGRPGSVAGTLGGSSEMDVVNFVGAFGAHRQ